MSSSLQLLIIAVILSSVNTLPANLKIGGLFALDEQQQETIFKFAVDKINADPNLLPQSTLTPLIEIIGKNDSFHADKKGESLQETHII